MKKKNVIITGALGQDGILLTNILLNTKKFNVFGIHNKKSKIKNIYKINLLDSLELKNFLIKHNPKFIFHFAAKNYSNNKKKKLNYKRDYFYNYRISINIIDAVISLNLKTKFFFAASSQMYDGYNNKIINESSPFFPINYYAMYKTDVHKYFMRFKKIKKIDGSTIIFFSHDSYYKNEKFLIRRLIKYFVNKKKLLINRIYKSNIVHDYSHAKDFCFAIYKLMFKKKLPDKIILSSFSKIYVNDIIIYLNKYFNLFLSDQTKKKHQIILGNNSFARKFINYKPKLNIYYLINELIEKKFKI
jgi:GDPmannose 4,6-dehydratase